MTTYYPNNSRNNLLRWYLLLWVCLASLWGLFEITSRTVSAAWSACSTGSESLDVCAQLKQHLGLQGQPDIASLPPAVLATLLQHAIIIFLLLLVLYGMLLWFSLSVERKPYLAWPGLCAQELIACLMSFFLPALSVTVPMSLLLVLILETCAICKQVRVVFAFSCAMILFFLLGIVLVWRQGYAWSSSSLSLVVALLLLVVGFLFVGGFFVLYTRLVQMHTAIETAYVRLEVASARIEELTLIMERQRMARELHDTLAQGLAGIILQLGVIHARVREQHDEDSRILLEQTLTYARETLADARSAIDDLRANVPSPVNLAEAAQEEIRRFTLFTGIPCATELGLLSQVSPADGEQVVGVIREGLTNVARHAHAQHVWVRVSRQRDALCLEIGDDGTGFDSAQALVQSGHYGLIGLQERAHLAGGQLAVLSAPGEGTRVQFFWSVEQPARETMGEE